MGYANAGRFVSFLITTTSNQDLIDYVKTTLSVDYLTVKKITVIANGSTTVNINSGHDSVLFQDLDGLSRLSLDSGDCIIESFIVKESGLTLWFGLIY